MAWTQPTRLQTTPIVNCNSGDWKDSQAFDEIILVDPHDASQLIMLLSGMAAPIQTGVQSIGRATAPISDVLSWTLDAGNPVLQKGTGGDWDNAQGGIRADAAVVVGTDIWLYYTADTASSGQAIGLAISSDSGETWTKHASNPVLVATSDETSVSQFAALRESANVWHGLYSYRKPGATLPAARYASSTDGIAWTKVTTDVLPTGPGDADSTYVEWKRLIKLESYYYVTWETGYGPGGTFGPYQTFCARALDPSIPVGTEGGWVKASGDAYPVFSNSGIAGRFDEFHIGSGGFYLINGQWYLFFSGGTPAALTSTEWAIGVATLGSQTPLNAFEDTPVPGTVAWRRV